MTSSTPRPVGISRLAFPLLGERKHTGRLTPTREKQNRIEPSSPALDPTSSIGGSGHTRHRADGGEHEAAGTVNTRVGYRRSRDPGNVYVTTGPSLKPSALISTLALPRRRLSHGSRRRTKRHRKSRHWWDPLHRPQGLAAADHADHPAHWKGAWGDRNLPRLTVQQNPLGQPAAF